MKNEEAAQASCAKAYVETLPKFFGCEYSGTLTKGGMFGARLLPEKLSGKSLAPLLRMWNYVEVPHFALTVGRSS